MEIKTTLQIIEEAKEQSKRFETPRIMKEWVAHDDLKFVEDKFLEMIGRINYLLKDVQQFQAVAINNHLATFQKEVIDKLNRIRSEGKNGN